jgi:hypothetical protein
MNAQMRVALRAAGLVDQVQTAITAANDPNLSDAWDYVPYINRSSAYVESLGGTIGLTSQQIDALFIQAAQIEF